MERAMFESQRNDIPARERAGNLYVHSPNEGRERGGYRGHVLESSVYTRAALSPGKALLAAGLGLAVFAGLRSFARSHE
jgi:hypothetical protein